MRSYCDRFKRSKKKKFMTKSIFANDNNTLNAYIYFANHLDYDTSAIVILKKNMHTEFFNSIN